MRPDKIRGNVFVANLPRGLTDEQLAELFDPYGMVLRAHLARDPATGKTLGHGLVLIAPDRVVDDAIGALNRSVMAGQRVEVRRADPDMSIAPPKPLRAPRGVGFGERFAAGASGAARDGRTPPVVVSVTRPSRTSGQGPYAAGWTRARDPHASAR